jgi:hypothetical protein
MVHWIRTILIDTEVFFFIDCPSNMKKNVDDVGLNLSDHQGFLSKSIASTCVFSYLIPVYLCDNS